MLSIIVKYYYFNCLIKRNSTFYFRNRINTVIRHNIIFYPSRKLYYDKTWKINLDVIVEYVCVKLGLYIRINEDKFWTRLCIIKKSVREFLIIIFYCSCTVRSDEISLSLINGLSSFRFEVLNRARKIIIIIANVSKTSD